MGKASLWVQHKSGQGQKWEVQEEFDRTYRAFGKDMLRVSLPKSEYSMCPQPERYEDVTAEYQVQERTGLIVHGVENCLPGTMSLEGDVVRKIDGLHNGPAFVVERRVS